MVSEYQGSYKFLRYIGISGVIFELLKFYIKYLPSERKLKKTLSAQEHKQISYVTTLIN